MPTIGYQDGIAGFISWLRKQPNVQKRGIGYDAADLSTWPWPDKLERTLRILKDEHDAAVPADPDPPPPPPPPPAPAFKRVAPKTVNEEGSSNQRFCMFDGGNLRPGVVRRPDGFYTDESGAVYAQNGDGLEESSVRNKDIISGLVGAKSMDGRSACECPTVGDPAKNTGSWKV